MLESMQDRFLEGRLDRVFIRVTWEDLGDVGDERSQERNHVLLVEHVRFLMKQLEAISGGFTFVFDWENDNYPIGLPAAHTLTPEQVDQVFAALSCSPLLITESHPGLLPLVHVEARRALLAA